MGDTPSGVRTPLDRSGIPGRAPVGRIAALVLATATATAADLAVRDLTLALETEPVELDWSVANGDTTLSGEDELASHAALVGGVRWSLARRGGAFGALIGAEAALGQGRFDPSGTLSWGEARLLAGGAWTPWQDWCVQGVVRAGAGISRLEFDRTDAFDGFAASGTHVVVAPEVALVWAPAGALRIWGGAGWRVARTPATGGGLDLEIEQSGPTLAIGLGWGFSEAPGALE